MKFSLVNLGCKVNRVEADSIGAALLAAGWEAVDGDADVAIVNTCTVTAEADRKTRKEVNRALARNEGAPVIVTGCAAAVDPDAYRALSPLVRVVAKGNVVQECFALGPHDSQSGKARFGHSLLCPVGPATEVVEARGAPALLRVGEDFPTRVGVKVQDGCNNACTYCIVHVARGKATSAPLEQVADEVASYGRAGVREVVLTGIDLGAYAYQGFSLADLVVRLRAAAPETRLRISSIEPVTIDDALVEVLATQEGMVCRHLHVPLQSGSSKVLHDMARRYDAECYLEVVDSLRDAIPGLSLTTDVIVGFPGETDQDFNDTMELAQACGFSRMHLFRYSKREGTPAAARLDQVTPQVKAERMARLSALADDLRLADAKSRLGTTERILVESDECAMSESYYEVKTAAALERGSLVEARLSGYDEKDGTFYL